MNSPRRRALLGTVGLAAVGANAGCLQAESRNSDAETKTSARPTPGTETDATTDTEESTDQPETESTTSPKKRTDDLFLKNRRADDQLLDLHVLRKPASTAGETDEESEESGAGSEDAEGGEGGGKRLVAQRYEVPASSTLELPNLGVVGNTYTVEVRLPGEEWQKFAWAVLDCAEYGTPTSEPRTPEEDPTLNTDAMVELRDDGIKFLRNECDAIMFSRDSAPPASEYVVRDSRTTTGT